MAGLVETDPARAVTSLVWLAAPFADPPTGGQERIWRVAAADTVTFGPLAGLDASCSSAICAPTPGGACSACWASRSRSRTTA